MTRVIEAPTTPQLAYIYDLCDERGLDAYLIGKLGESAMERLFGV